jgi:hypothetical protein
MSLLSEGIELLGAVNKAANADLYAKLGKYIDEVHELYSERDKLQAENRELRDKLRFKGSMIRLGRMVYVDGDDEPLCSRCADVASAKKVVSHHASGKQKNRDGQDHYEKKLCQSKQERNLFFPIGLVTLRRQGSLSCRPNARALVGVNLHLTFKDK